MMRRMNEKKEEEKNEAYYLQKIEELRKRKNAENVKPALIVQEDEDEFGQVEVWSTDSEDEKVRKPMHGECFVAKVVAKEHAGKCLVVHGEVSEQKEFVTESYFAARTVIEHVKECENVINKVHSILQSHDITVARYEYELDYWNYTFFSFSDSLKRTRLNNSNLTDQISRKTSISEERRMWIEKLELELSRSRDDVIYLK